MDFTYEKQNTSGKLETYEWDNIWWEQAPDFGKRRVLIIGDSISCGYRRFVTEEFAGAAYADGLGTSKALDNEYFYSAIDYMLGQRREYCAVQFNNGLHGWHLDDDGYRENYIKMVSYLKEHHGIKRLVLALTTPTRDTRDLSLFDARNEIVIRRNEIVRKIAAECGAEINDLYSPISQREDLWSPDGVHLREAGYRLLAKRCAELLLPR